MNEDLRQQRMTAATPAAYLQHVLDRIEAFYPTNSVHVHFDEEGVMSLTVEGENDHGE